jgi:hypothetical protein
VAISPEVRQGWRAWFACAVSEYMGDGQPLDRILEPIFNLNASRDLLLAELKRVRRVTTAKRKPA